MSSVATTSALPRAPVDLSWRTPALACACYLIAAALSYIDSRLAIGCCILVCAEAARRDADLSLFLLVFALPFDRIFYLRESDQLIVLAAQMALQVAALALHRRPDPFALLGRSYWTDTLRYTVWPLLGAYAVLAIANVHPELDWMFRLKTMAFGGTSLLLVMIYDGRMEPRTVRAVVGAVIISSLVQIVLDTAFLAGLREMLPPPQTLLFDPVFSGRLMGLTLSANDLAEYLVCAFCFAGAPVMLGQRAGRGVRLGLVVLLYGGVAMTLSKGALLATGVVLIGAALGFLMLARWDLLLRASAGAGLCALIVFGTTIVPFVTMRIMMMERAASGALSQSDDVSVPSLSKLPLVEIMEYLLRVGVASERLSDVDRHVEASEGEIICELACTGHRDELWAAGLDVVRRNWLTGIGFGGWRFEIHKRLGFAYTSPHNATLHLWGMFGLAGLALNLGLYALIARRAYGLRSLLTERSQEVAWALASTAFLLIVMVHEVFETSMILSLSRFGLFAWLMLAVQSSAIRSASRLHQPARGGLGEVTA